MKLQKTKLTLAVAVAVGIGAPSSAYATYGYFSHAYSTKTGGVAGSGVALAQDSLIAAINPAGMALVGDRKDIGIALFSPLREYNVTGAAATGSPTDFPPFPGSTVESDSNIFFIPHLGFNWPLGDNKSSVGVSVYGNGGMNTDYDAADTAFGLGTFAGGKAGIDYSQLFITTTYARKINDKAAWGVSGIVNYTSLEVEGLGAFAGFSTSPTKLSDNGADTEFGFGVKVGVIGEVAPGFSLGASYQSKIKNTFDDYAGLFANGGELDIPATATIGLAFEPNDKSVITFDIQRIWYSDVDAIGNSGSRLFACMGGDATQCLGGSNGAGFGWEDMTAYKLGYQIDTGNGWTWRAGFGTGKQPIPESEVTLNILAPGVVEEHITFGFTKKNGPKKEFSMAFMYAPSNSVKGPALFNPGREIELTMKQYQIEASWSW